jgi:hypothetical protein
VLATGLELPLLALIELREAGGAKPQFHFLHAVEARRCRVQEGDEIGHRGAAGGPTHLKSILGDKALFWGDSARFRLN